jgi:hypothetical protein
MTHHPTSIILCHAQDSSMSSSVRNNLKKCREGRRGRDVDLLTPNPNERCTSSLLLFSHTFNTYALVAPDCPMASPSNTVRKLLKEKIRSSSELRIGLVS